MNVKAFSRAVKEDNIVEKEKSQLNTFMQFGGLLSEPGARDSLPCLNFTPNHELMDGQLVRFRQVWVALELFMDSLILRCECVVLMC